MMGNGRRGSIGRSGGGERGTQTNMSKLKPQPFVE